MSEISPAEQRAFTQGYNAGYSQGQADASQFREPSTEQSGGTDVDQDSLWMAVCIECCPIEKIGVMKVIQNLKDKFTISQK